MQTVKTFIFNEKEPPVETSEANIAPIEQAPEKIVLEDVREYLLSMDKRNRDSFLTDLFKDDLTFIIEQESQKGFKQGYKEGYENGTVDVQEKSVSSENLLTQKCEQWQKLIDTFSSEANEIKIDQAERVAEIINIALFRLLGERIELGEYLDNLLQQVVNEFAHEKSVILLLSTHDMSLVNSHEFQIPGNLQLKTEDSLLPGCYRIELSAGQVHSDLSEKLRLMLKDFNDQQQERTK